MKCSNCKAEFTPPKGHTITKCPFCGEPMIKISVDGKDTPPHEILLNVTQQFGREILSEAKLRGILADLMPNAEKRHLRILRQAVDDGIGARLLEMQSDTYAVRTLKITTLKENFRNNNAFNHTADYVVDCFMYAMGWYEGTPIEKTNHVTVDSLNILNRQVELAFSDGKLTKDESKSLFLLATSLNIPESQIAGIIQKEIDELNLTSESPIDSSSQITKEFICSYNWIESKNFAAVTIGNQELMKRSLDVSNFQHYDPKPKATKNEIDQNRTGNRCYPRIGGNEGFEERIGSFIDSGIFEFDKATTRVAKFGQNAGRQYFVAPAIDGGRNGCFTWEEMVALELSRYNLGLVGGDRGVDEKGKPYIANPFLILGRGIFGWKVNGVLKLVE